MADDNNNNVWQKDAIAIARQFVMTLNGSMLYGCTHPNTEKNAAALCDVLREAFRGRDMITIISNNGTLMIEDYPLDKSFNIGRILKHFDKLGLISISFEQGVTAESIAQLVGIVGNVANIDGCRAEVERAKAPGVIPRIRINYVLYGKIRADEIVVKDAPGGLIGTPALNGASNIATGNLSLRAAAEIEQVLTLSSLLEKPKEISAILAQTDTGAFKVGELQGAFGKIKSELDEAKTYNVDELLESLYGLKKDLYEAIEVQKATGRVMRSAAVINNELNELTSRAIVKLVRDEYKSGKTPLNRLAHTIRRMLPNNAELMHILPRLKEMLLADGMALGDYLEFVKMLGLKVESETLTDTLKDAAESMGASVSDLVAAIQARPEEAARLILLASEIRKGMGEDESRLPEVLTGYIEEISSKMAVNTCAADNLRDSGTLKKVLAQLESQMFSQLSGQGISKDVMQNVKHLLAARFGDAVATVTEGLAPGAKKHRAEKVKMPQEALSAGNLLFLVNKEIKRGLRYKSPFATITVSIEKIITRDDSRPPKPEDSAELLPQLFVEIEALLRDVDLIGAIGAENNPELFILLPMTDEEGAAIVRERITKTIRESAFSIANRKANVSARISVTLPNETTTDLKSYLALSRRNHKASGGS